MCPLNELRRKLKLDLHANYLYYLVGSPVDSDNVHIFEFGARVLVVDVVSYSDIGSIIGSIKVLQGFFDVLHKACFFLAITSWCSCDLLFVSLLCFSSLFSFSLCLRFSLFVGFLRVEATTTVEVPKAGTGSVLGWLIKIEQLKFGNCFPCIQNATPLKFRAKSLATHHSTTGLKHLSQRFCGRPPLIDFDLCRFGNRYRPRNF